MKKNFSNAQYREIKHELYEEYMRNQPMRDGEEIRDFLNDVGKERKNEHEL